MTSISGVQQVVALIQAEIANRPEAQRLLREARRTGRGRRAGRPAAAGAALAARLRTQLGSIEAGCPDYERRVFRVFIEGVLATQFGDAVLLDPAFFRMVDDVEHQMRQSPTLAPLINSAVQSLTQPLGAKLES